MENIDWEKIYDVFDGNMKDCLGKSCSDSCCEEKDIYVYKKPNITFSTTFFRLSERDYQRDVLKPNYEDLSVRSDVYDIGMDRSCYQILVDNCLDPKNGCKLSERKPLICRVFPFKLDAYVPFYATGCLQLFDVVNDEEVISSIMEIRTLLGCEDNKLWRANLEKFKLKLREKSACNNLG